MLKRLKNVMNSIGWEYKDNLRVVEHGKITVLTIIVKLEC